MEYFNWFFFGPAKLIGQWPYAGVVIAAVLIGMQTILLMRAKKTFGLGFFREAPVFAGILWLIFNAFELQMSAIAARGGTGGGGLLRMDLIVLVPILYVLTAAALSSLAKQMSSPDKPDDSHSGN